MTTPKLTRYGTLRTDGRELEVAGDPAARVELLVALDESETARAMHEQRVRITIEPASAPEQAAPVDAPPAHGSPLDYLAELKGLLTGLLDAHPSPSEEQTDIAIRRCLTLANAATLAILTTQRGTR